MNHSKSDDPKGETPTAVQASGVSRRQASFLPEIRFSPIRSRHTSIFGCTPAEKRRDVCLDAEHAFEGGGQHD